MIQYITEDGVYTIGLCRKPLSEKSVVDNVFRWGVGGLNIDGCRIGEGTGETKTITQKGAKFKTWSNDPLETRWYEQGFNKSEGNTYEVKDLGRWPANLILDKEAGKILDKQSGTIKSSGGTRKKDDTKYDATSYNKVNPQGQNSNPYSGDTGGASRFFYCPKASKSDRDEGLTTEAKAIKGRDEGQDKMAVAYKARPTERQNIHPTVKPTDLMAYLIRLVTPKGGVVLDPFMGSGSTGKAAVIEDMDFIGIEREEEYYEIAKQRIENETNKRKFW